MNNEYMSQSSVDIPTQDHKTIILVSFMHSGDYCSTQKTQERSSFFLDAKSSSLVAKSSSLDSKSYINQFSNPIYT